MEGIVITENDVKEMLQKSIFEINDYFEGLTDEDKLILIGYIRKYPEIVGRGSLSNRIVEFIENKVDDIDFIKETEKNFRDITLANYYKKFPKGFIEAFDDLVSKIDEKEVLVQLLKEWSMLYFRLILDEEEEEGEKEKVVLKSVNIQLKGLVNKYWDNIDDRSKDTVREWFFNYSDSQPVWIYDRTWLEKFLKKENGLKILINNGADDVKRICKNDDLRKFYYELYEKYMDEVFDMDDSRLSVNLLYVVLKTIDREILSDKRWEFIGVSEQVISDWEFNMDIKIAEEERKEREERKIYNVIKKKTKNIGRKFLLFLEKLPVFNWFISPISILLDEKIEAMEELTDSLSVLEDSFKDLIIAERIGEINEIVEKMKNETDGYFEEDEYDE